MSILIRGVKMPENTEGCEVIIRIQPDGTVLNLQGIHLDAKAVTVPAHGRLIDADALMDLIRAHDYPLTAHFNSTDNGMFTIGIQQAVDEISTIIEAEGEGEKEEENRRMARQNYYDQLSALGYNPDGTPKEDE